VPGPGRQLSKAQVVARVQPLRAAAHAGASKHAAEGTAVIQFMSKPDGSVARAVLAGDLVGTPVGECVILAARELKFDSFEGPLMRFNYPVPVR